MNKQFAVGQKVSQSDDTLCWAAVCDAIEGDVMVRIGYAPGAYDMFHIGHLNILKHAKSRCDFLIAGVVSDERCAITKGKTPVIPLAERLEIVGSIQYVDLAVAETVPEKLDAWRQLRFNMIFKGDDWRGTPKGDKLESDFAGVGVEVVYFPYTVHTSSTLLRRALSMRVGDEHVSLETG